MGFGTYFIDMLLILIWLRRLLGSLVGISDNLPKRCLAVFIWRYCNLFNYTVSSTRKQSPKEI